MSTYFNFIPGELVGLIGLYLDAYSIKNLYDSSLSSELISNYFWIQKYDIDFPNITWRIFIKDLPSDMEQLWKIYSVFRFEYNNLNNWLIRGTGIGSSINEWFNMLTINGQKQLSPDLYQWLNYIISLYEGNPDFKLKYNQNKSNVELVPGDPKISGMISDITIHKIFYLSIKDAFDFVKSYFDMQKIRNKNFK
jgi:hypothetical protein